MDISVGLWRKLSAEECDAFELCCWIRLLRVPETARRSNYSILKEISPEYSLEGLKIKLKLQYFGNCCSVMSNYLQPHGMQHARLPCPSQTPRVYSNSCPLSRWYHSTSSSSVIPFSSCLQSFPASASFPMSQFLASGGQNVGASASAQSFQWIFRVDLF